MSAKDVRKGMIMNSYGDRETSGEIVDRSHNLLLRQVPQLPVRLRLTSDQLIHAITANSALTTHSRHSPPPL